MPADWPSMSPRGCCAWVCILLQLADAAKPAGVVWLLPVVRPACLAWRHTQLPCLSAKEATCHPRCWPLPSVLQLQPHVSGLSKHAHCWLDGQRLCDQKQTLPHCCLQQSSGMRARSPDNQHAA